MAVAEATPDRTRLTGRLVFSFDLLRAWAQSISPTSSPRRRGSVQTDFHRKLPAWTDLGLRRDDETGLRVLHLMAAFAAATWRGNAAANIYSGATSLRYRCHVAWPRIGRTIARPTRNGNA